MSDTKLLKDMSIEELNDKSFVCGQKLLKLNREQEKLYVCIIDSLFDIISKNIEYSKYLLVPRIKEDDKNIVQQKNKLQELLMRARLNVDRMHTMLEGIIQLNHYIKSSTKYEDIKDIQDIQDVQYHKKLIEQNINVLRHIIHNINIQLKIREEKNNRIQLQREKETKLNDIVNECSSKIDIIKKYGKITFKELLK